MLVKWSNERLIITDPYRSQELPSNILVLACPGIEEGSVDNERYRKLGGRESTYPRRANMASTARACVLGYHTGDLSEPGVMRRRLM